MKSRVLIALLAALAFSVSVHGQTADTEADRSGAARMPPAEGGMGMHDEGGMHGHHHMHGRHGMHGMQGMMRGMHGIRFPPGYEKLELEMHAEMMESMASILKKYAAKLPDKE